MLLYRYVVKVACIAGVGLSRQNTLTWSYILYNLWVLCVCMYVYMVTNIVTIYTVLIHRWGLQYSGISDRVSWRSHVLTDAHNATTPHNHHKHTKVTTS